VLGGMQTNTPPPTCTGEGILGMPLVRVLFLMSQILNASPGGRGGGWGDGHERRLGMGGEALTPPSCSRGSRVPPTPSLVLPASAALCRCLAV